MSSTSGLTVRQYERETIELRVELVVAEHHRDQVRFSPTSPAVDAHVLRGTAVDVSPGGMGVLCRQFVPRMCEGTIRVFDPTPVGTASDGTPIHEVAFEHGIKVRRVTMDSHEPTYALGLAFVDPEPGIQERIERLLRRPSDRPPGDRGGGPGDA